MIEKPIIRKALHEVLFASWAIAVAWLGLCINEEGQLEPIIPIKYIVGYIVGCFMFYLIMLGLVQFAKMEEMSKKEDNIKKEDK